MRHMTWVQRGLSPPSYELLCDGKSLGSLGWVEESSTAALMEAAGRFFILRKAGLLSQRVVVETLTKTTVARISLSSLTRSGQLRLPRGERYSFAFNGSLEWTDAHGRLLARVGAGAEKGEVTENATVQVPLLLFFAGWYLHRTLGKGNGRSGPAAFGTGSA
jgi:hypothetical protein